MTHVVISFFLVMSLGLNVSCTKKNDDSESPAEVTKPDDKTQPSPKSDDPTSVYNVNSSSDPDSIAEAIIAASKKSDAAAIKKLVALTEKRDNFSTSASKKLTQAHTEIIAANCTECLREFLKIKGIEYIESFTAEVSNEQLEKTVATKNMEMLKLTASVLEKKGTERFKFKVDESQKRVGLTNYSSTKVDVWTAIIAYSTIYKWDEGGAFAAENLKNDSMPYKTQADMRSYITRVAVQNNMPKTITGVARYQSNIAQFDDQFFPAYLEKMNADVLSTVAKSMLANGHSPTSLLADAMEKLALIEPWYNKTSWDNSSGYSQFVAKFTISKLQKIAAQMVNITYQTCRTDCGIVSSSLISSLKIGYENPFRYDQHRYSRWENEIVVSFIAELLKNNMLECPNLLTASSVAAQMQMHPVASAVAMSKCEHGFNGESQFKIAKSLAEELAYKALARVLQQRHFRLAAEESAGLLDVLIHALVSAKMTMLNTIKEHSTGIDADIYRHYAERTALGTLTAILRTAAVVANNSNTARYDFDLIKDGSSKQSYASDFVYALAQLVEQFAILTETVPKNHAITPETQLLLDTGFDLMSKSAILKTRHGPHNDSVFHRILLTDCASADKCEFPKSKRMRNTRMVSILKRSLFLKSVDKEALSAKNADDVSVSDLLK